MWEVYSQNKQIAEWPVILVQCTQENFGNIHATLLFGHMSVIGDRTVQPFIYYISPFKKSYFENSKLQ